MAYAIIHHCAAIKGEGVALPFVSSPTRGAVPSWLPERPCGAKIPRRAIIFTLATIYPAIKVVAAYTLAKLQS